MKPQKRQEQDFELNLASIIDCFTVLVTFLLASSAFISIGILDAGIAAGGISSTQKDHPPSIQIFIELKKNNEIHLSVSGKTTRSIKIHPQQEGWDFKKLDLELKSLKASYPDVESLILSADETVSYKEIIIAMEKVKQTIPVVMLGGY